VSLGDEEERDLEEAFHKDRGKKNVLLRGGPGKEIRGETEKRLKKRLVAHCS